MAQSITVTALAPLEGFGASGIVGEDFDAMGKALAAQSRQAFGAISPEDLATALRLLSSADRQAVIVAYTTADGAGATLSKALEILKPPAKTALTAVYPYWAALSTLSMAAGAFHGYRRNQSVGWALWWGLMGATFPVITPTIALAQGFGKPRR